MTKTQRLAVWFAAFVTLLLIIHSLRDILLPFVAGMAVAYFLDPLADKLEERGLSRILATILITLVFFLIIVGGIVLLFPLLQNQFVAIAERIPDLFTLVEQLAKHILEKIETATPSGTFKIAGDAAGEYVGTIAGWLKAFVARLWSGGVALFSLVSLIVITPIVSFYMLLEWDLIVAKLDFLLPRRQAPIIRKQFLLMDLAISAFVRGQASVCLVLALYYGISLSILGLETGLLIGLGAGLASFVPYVGAISGMAIGVGIAVLQFDTFTAIIAVAIVFIIGQLVESYVLTPRLVGDKVGLHDLWIIFALLTGGSLFGFTGVLLAVPLAAVMGVIIRFLIGEYLDSPLYKGKTTNTE